MRTKCVGSVPIRALNVSMPALWLWLKIQRDWPVFALASPAIVSALRAPEIASLVLAHPQLWENAQMHVASVWQSAKSTQFTILRAKHVRKPVVRVSNTAKARRNRLSKRLTSDEQGMPIAEGTFPHFKNQQSLFGNRQSMPRTSADH